MSDIEKQLIKDEKLLEIIKKHFKSIDKIKKKKIETFIKKYKKDLDKITTKRNWSVWLTSIKKKYIKLEEESAKGTGLVKNRSDSNSLSSEPSVGEATREYERNKEREKQRRKEEVEEIEKQLEPYNAKLIKWKDVEKYVNDENTNVLVLANGDNIVIDDENLFKLKEDENQFIHKLDDGRVILVDNLTDFVHDPWTKEKESEEESDDKTDEDEPDEESDEEIILRDSDSVSVSQHRKSFVKWVNKDLYKKVESLKNDSPLQIYQVLIREYLSLEMPYRGVLVYHGLGTGKTASAVSLAEGLSTELRINTILPASLETEFIKEVQKWGHEELNKESLWKYYSDEDISNQKLVSKIEEEYNLSPDGRKKIMKNTINYLRRKMKNENPDITKLEIKKMENEIKKISGVWLPDKNGKSLHVEEGEEENFNDYEKLYIEQQMNYLIEKKYNFIHYNPFPKVKNSTVEEFIEEDDEQEDIDLLLDPNLKKELNTKNKKLVNRLEKKLQNNRREYQINSPFYNEVIIIDEVHNFVRQILNDESIDKQKKIEARRAKIFYNWIVNAQDVKLIFLSGTPVINKPSEIAILYNMLKGLIKIYSFTVKTDILPDEATEKLNDFYFKNPSPIEIFHVEANKGKLVISFIQESGNFKSLRDEESNIIFTVKTNDTDYKDFIDHIYDGLHKVFKKDEILPKKSTFKNLNNSEINKIKLGNPVIYDEELNIVFNRQQKLFDIYHNGNMIDTTNNSEFMSYFFEGGNIVPEKKKILLKRMLMGLTSYYPIDRSSIVYMPQIVKPHIELREYSGYKIVKNMNIVKCMMSQIQFENYIKGWDWQKDIEMYNSKRNIWEDEVHHYSIRTRQACNVVFNDEENFRMMKKGNTDDKTFNDQRNKLIEKLKQEAYSKVLDEKLFKIDKSLNDYSPKFLEIYKNMQRFTRDKRSTGKILFYSDFRSDAGSEAFELMLKCNGYSKLDTEKLPDTKELRYTFITGSESPEERRLSKIYFNDDRNKYGEYCQVMIISSAGAEGISLTCVRQVHILEPYWNYVRIDQVLGRAIRMRSHTGSDLKNPTLPKEKQNVEQYLYISDIPEGIKPESVYQSIHKLDNWNIPDNWAIEDVTKELSKEANREHKELIESIIKLNTEDKSADNYLFDIMEEKYKFSLQINDIIRESSLDCIQHTLDDPELNDKCIRFSDKLSGEIAYFPGITSNVLEKIDIIQLKSKFIYHIKPDIYVISAKDKTNERGLYLYYQYETDKSVDDIDIRYLRENGKRLCDLYLDTKMLLNYVDSKHPYNQRLDKEFSVYQEIYKINDDIIENYINKDKFPSLDKFIHKDNLEGYKLKYNINDTFYYMGIDSILPDKCIQKIYPYFIYEEDNYSVYTEKPIIILDGQVYIKD